MSSLTTEKEQDSILSMMPLQAQPIENEHVWEKAKAESLSQYAVFLYAGFSIHFFLYFGPEVHSVSINSHPWKRSATAPTQFYYLHENNYALPWGCFCLGFH